MTVFIRVEIKNSMLLITNLIWLLFNLMKQLERGGALGLLSDAPDICATRFVFAFVFLLVWYA